MLRELKFVQGAVAKKDFLPAMTHFSIDVDDAGGFVRAYNGALALGSPIAFNIPCKPKASDLVAAIAKCKDTPTLTMTEKGRLRVASGKFKGFVDCVQEETPHVSPEGERVEFNGESLLKALHAIEPFIGTDASRPWSNGVLLRGGSALATNNVTLIEYWLACNFPITVNLPRQAVAEMLRINEPPLYAQVTQYSMSFHYADRRWLRTQLLATDWPDMGKILDGHDAKNAKPVDPQLFEGLEMVKPFVDKMGRIFLRDGKISTVTKEGEEDKHADFELTDFPYEGCYQIAMLELLNGVAATADLSLYPRPVIFYGDNLRGAIVGMRL